MDSPSRNQVKKAGAKLRRHARGDARLTPSEYGDVLDCISRWRASHGQPLVTCNNGLRSMVRTLGIDGQVTQRLKRIPTIVDKVCARETTLSLDRMRDIGWCRVIVPTREDAYRLSDHLKSRRAQHVVDFVDYMATPRSSGYRALHVVVEYGPDPRPIEVQIRTPGMQAWAEFVERQSGYSGVNYKQDGSTEFHDLMREIADIIAGVETRALQVTEGVSSLLRQLQLPGIADLENR